MLQQKVNTVKEEREGTVEKPAETLRLASAS